jgi:cephalosporin-C deacetylase-like acetyl esterase
MRTLTFALALCAATPALYAQSASPAGQPTQEVAKKAPQIVWGKHPALPVVQSVGGKPELLRQYRMPATRFKISLGTPTNNRTFIARPASFPSPVQKRWGTIHGTYYRPAKASATNRVPAAVVVHHLGGGFEAEEILAQFLAANGVATFTVSLPNYGKRREPNSKQGFMTLATKDPFAAFGAFRQAVKDVIRSGDFLRNLPEIDSNRVGVVGVSLGAFVTAVAKGVDPRFRQTMLILGGGDLTSLLGSLPDIAKYKGSIDALKPMLLPLIAPVDPVNFADRVNPAEVRMLNALQDEIVPRQSTDALWNALGRPKIHWFDCGHYGIALHLLTVMNETLDHLKKRPAF